MALLCATFLLPLPLCLSLISHGLAAMRSFPWVILLVPYVLILWWVHGPQPSDTGRIKRGLALAVACGSMLLLFVLIAVLGLSASPLSDRTDVASLAVLMTFWLLALSQAALVGSAIRTYYSMNREARDRALILRSFGIVAVVFFVLSFFFVLPQLSRTREAWNEAGAVNVLRKINTAQVTYGATYPHKGAASTLVELGPPPDGKEPSENAADLIDAQLVTGETSGYRVTLSPGPRDTKGSMASYTISAQPLQYERTGCRSFFTDESAVVRWTWEDRAATAKDPPI